MNMVKESESTDTHVYTGMQYYALMCKHMHTERLDFFQTSIDMHIYYKITAQDRRYVHIQAHMHSLSFFLTLAESVKAQKG